MDNNSYNKEDILRVLLQRSIDQERILLENEKRDRLSEKRHHYWNLIYLAVAAGCTALTIGSLVTTHNVQSGNLRPIESPTPIETPPLYFTP
jgi:hypothetical protein